MDYKKWVSQEIAKISTNSKIALYVAANCDYLLPNYAYFHDMTGWGNPEKLNFFLSRFFDAVKGDELSKKDISEGSTQLDSIMPDLDDHTDNWVSYAFDACAAFDIAFKFFKGARMEHAIDVAVCAFDSTDMFTQDLKSLYSANNSLGGIMDIDSYMKKEIERQRLILQYLEKCHAIITDDDISFVKKININTPCLPLNLL
jgi:uncharacterized protein